MKMNDRLTRLEQHRNHPGSQQQVIAAMRAKLDNPDLSPQKRELVELILHRQSVALFSEMHEAADVGIGSFAELYPREAKA